MEPPAPAFGLTQPQGVKQQVCFSLSPNLHKSFRLGEARHTRRHHRRALRTAHATPAASSLQHIRGLETGENPRAGVSL